MMYGLRSEYNLRDSVPSFQHVGPGSELRLLGLAASVLSLLNHSMDPSLCFYVTTPRVSAPPQQAPESYD